MEDVNELEKLENLYRECINLDFPEKTVDDKLELFCKKTSYYCQR